MCSCHRFHDHSLQTNQMMLSQQQQQQPPPPPLPQQQQQQSWPQQQTMIRMPLMPSATPPTPASTTPTQDRSGSSTAEHSNLMERTREDELLGTNATMSNVLYCNVNHPDLKQQFPGKYNSSASDLAFSISIQFSVLHYTSPCE